MPLTQKKQRKRSLRKLGKQLNRYRPKAEVWFDSYINLLPPPNKAWVKKNSPHYGYIPDYRFKFLGVIIEIDEPHHALRQDKDRKRDLHFKRNGIVTIRVRAYDDKRALEAITYVYGLMVLSRTQCLARRIKVC